MAFEDLTLNLEWFYLWYLVILDCKNRYMQAEPYCKKWP